MCLARLFINEVLMGTDRYAPVREALPAVMPAITRIEAERAAAKLYRKFAPDRWKARKPVARRCWISRSETAGHHKGWGRLVHDVSHSIFRLHYPRRRPHDPLHSHYETMMAEYVVAQGWLDGKLKPRTKAKPTREERRSAELVKVEAAIKRWETKAKRAATALKKLKAKQRRMLRAASG